MNRQLVIGGIIGAVAVTAIGGVASYKMLDNEQYAEVVSVEPVMTTVKVPREQCRDEAVNVKKPVKDTHQVTGTVAGAVIGGVLGSKVGGGSGKDIATVGGAVAGGYAGNKIQEKIQDGNTEQQLRQVCETVYESRQQQEGFDVTYRFNGVEKMVHMNRDPGRRLPVENGRVIVNADS